ncbi:hypothetical protein J4760_04625 [Salinicoccus sp. ID82-1]|uniref:hypothetical protein n=1 Tax=Salinicoccus sp. ID82-1 TaxID=2820269 RepID=UPI001F267B38|nr:hypothetical protein [Salinicoccus sp. ID82-1]MCG1009337.1 hypothetical protein [Salinicoccus sp. ID82-1]
MTEYIYLASDKPLALGSVGDRGIHIGNLSWYPTENAAESFYFEELENEKNIYETDSYAYKLPERGTKKVSGMERKAVSLLYDYIKAHFAENDAYFLTIKFVLNGYENGFVKEKRSIKLEELQKVDLYYSEAALLEVVK